MTVKIFWETPYLSKLTTVVESVCGNQVTLYDTIFYAFSGGQESDMGTINDYPVLCATKNKSDIYYTLPENHKIRKNDTVCISIDWNRRYKLMRLHSAAEIILLLLCKKLPSLKK